MMNTDEILVEARRCVRCAYCLPHCPTYRTSQDEAESPRGRIALAAALASGVPAEESLRLHLDHCLVCRACEAACPSRVKYGELIANTRALLAEQTPKVVRGAGLHLLTRAPYGAFLPRLGGFSWGLARRALTGYEERLGDLAPERLTVKSWRAEYPAGEGAARVGLFTGCISRVVDAPVIEAVIRLLRAVGCTVALPREQTCCGAIHRHAGDAGQEQSFCETNRQAFAAAGVERVVAIASGCGAQLREQQPGLGVEVNDVSRYLLESPRLAALRFRPFEGRVRVHTPCTLKNVLGEHHAPLELLRRIPGLDLAELGDNGLCCGGAGLNLLTQPDIADGLLKDKLQAIEREEADVVLTSNTGCALHLRAGLRRAASRVRVMHPVELLAAQLDEE